MKSSRGAKLALSAPALPDAAFATVSPSPVGAAAAAEARWVGSPPCGVSATAALWGVPLGATAPAAKPAAAAAPATLLGLPLTSARWGMLAPSLLAPSLPPPAPDAAPPASAALAAAAAACIRAASPAAPERLRRDLDGYPRKRKAAGQPTDQ